MMTEEQAVASVEPTVKFMARRYSRYGYDFDDLCQVGRLAAIRSFRLFDARPNVKFTTYANKRIAGGMLQFMRDYGRGIRVAAWMTEQPGFDYAAYAPVSYDQWEADSVAALGSVEDVAEEVTGELSFDYLLGLVTPRQAQVLRMLLVEQMEAGEVARRLGIVVNSVYNTRDGGLRRLRVLNANCGGRLLNVGSE